MSRRALYTVLMCLSLLPMHLCADNCCSGCGVGWWADLDYLLLWRKDRHIPPLVTGSRSGTETGILGSPDTIILFGDGDLENFPQHGVYGDVGFWISPSWGIGAGGFGTTDDTTTFYVQAPAGTPVLARPFFDVLNDTQSSLLVAFPGIFTNSQINIKDRNRLWEANVYVRWRLFDRCLFTCDALAGYLYTQVRDELEIDSSFRFDITTFGISDGFYCTNSYNAAMLGLNVDWDNCFWGASLTGKLGFGCMHSHVDIKGFTSETPPGVDLNGGLLGLISNIGNHIQDKFEVVPQLNCDVRYHLNSNVSLTLGYMFIYWPSVALAGDQVNLNVNPTLVPAFALPLTPPGQPSFAFHNTSFWAQGLTLGFRFRF